MNAQTRQPGANARGDLLVHAPPRAALVAGGLAGTLLAAALAALAIA